MSRKRAAAGGIGALSILLTAGLTLAPAANATEKHGEHTGTSAFAISAAGLLKIDRTPDVDGSAGFSQKSFKKFETPGGAVKADILNAEAGANRARASVLKASVDLSALTGKSGTPGLTAEAITAKCDGSEGSSSLAKVFIAGKKLDVSAPANTVVGVPGVASVTLNKQVKHDDGSVRVTAIEINVDGIQKIELASVTCAGGEEGNVPVPTTPGNPTAPVTAPTPAPVPSTLPVTG